MLQRKLSEAEAKLEDATFALANLAFSSEEQKEKILELERDRDEQASEAERLRASTAEMMDMNKMLKI